jgi:hypothetical protein
MGAGIASGKIKLVLPLAKPRKMVGMGALYSGTLNGIDLWLVPTLLEAIAVDRVTAEEPKDLERRLIERMLLERSRTGPIATGLAEATKIC